VIRIGRWRFAALLVAAIVVAEILCRVAIAPLELPFYSSGPAGENLRLIPSQGAKTVVNGRTIFVSTDADGHRTTLNAPRQGMAQRRLDIIGDSQVFGWGLDDKETIPSRLEARLGANWRIVNHGLPGVGPLRYAEELKGVPQDAEVLIVFTEVNDLWDMYDVARFPTRCGYLTKGTLPPWAITCAVLRLRLLQLGYAAFDTWGDRRALAPVGFDETSLVAAHILAFRVRELFAAARARGRPKIHFAVVPWQGRFDPSVWADYFPRADPKAPRYFDDDFAMIETFARAPRPALLFQDHDPHLSADGARLFADHVADTLQTEDRAGPAHNGR
jgi:lysophospholipase L1-like esterase